MKNKKKLKKLAPFVKNAKIRDVKMLKPFHMHREGCIGRLMGRGEGGGGGEQEQQWGGGGQQRGGGGNSGGVNSGCVFSL